MGVINSILKDFMFKTLPLVCFGLAAAQGIPTTTSVPACQGRRVRESVASCHVSAGDRDCWIVNWNNNCVKECEQWLTMENEDKTWFKTECPRTGKEEVEDFINNVTAEVNMF